MPEDKPRLARLASILTQLQSKTLINATELAEKHGVSIRTIYRDIRTLEKSGIPVVTEEGRGYTILEGYKLPPVMFTEEEANALITAEQIINRNKDQSLSEHYQNAVTKVKAVFKSTQKEKAELLENRLQIRTNQQELKTSSYLIELQSAITNYQLVQLDYLSLEGVRSQRDIEPFALFSTQENWLLVAYCRLRKDFRAFRLDYIQEIRLSGAAFEPHDMTLQEYFEQCRQKQKHL
ncbi:MAG: YafY family transcriptional regulator [Roseivirga sp.]|nr:YafY family transcriptional regulator [Roseivirga sp.]